MEQRIATLKSCSYLPTLNVASHVMRIFRYKNSGLLSNYSPDNMVKHYAMEILYLIVLFSNHWDCNWHSIILPVRARSLHASFQIPIGSPRWPQKGYNLTNFYIFDNFLAFSLPYIKKSISMKINSCTYIFCIIYWWI